MPSLVIAVVLPAQMFAGDLTVTWLGRLISNLIIPLINVWCLGALAGVTITSVRPPETVKQTPAKPESRSQAKTLPVSSGLWREDVHSRERPPLHREIVQTGKILENDYSGYEAQFHDNWDWLIPGIVVLLWRSSKAVNRNAFLLWLRNNKKIVFGFLIHLDLFINDFPVTFDIVICGLWSLEMVKLIS